MSEIRISQVDYQPSPEGYELISGNPDHLYGLHKPTVEYEELEKRFEQGNDTYEVITGPSGRQYEIAIFNPEKLSVARILKPSTSFSSLYKNPGNALETALTAAANPGAAYIYIASFGNHPTGHMDSDDLGHVAKTGRYTTGDGSPKHPYRPLDSVACMAQALENHYLDLGPTHLSADVEGGRLALGLMSAFETDSVQGAYLNGLDGLSPSASYVRAKLAEDLGSRIQRRAAGDGEVGELTPVNIKDVKRHMPNIYSGLGRIAHLAPLPVLLFPHDDWDKLQVTRGFRGHNDLDDLRSHAVYQDMQAALRQQEATVTLQFNQASAIHDLNDCKGWGKMVMNGLPEQIRSQNRRVRLLLGEGTLDQHTDAPHDRTRIERYAFPDILQRMVGLKGGLVLDSQVFKLQPLRESA